MSTLFTEETSMAESREDKIGSVSEETERQQYTPMDTQRIKSVTAALTQSTIDLIGALAAYDEAVSVDKTDQETANAIAYARRDMIEMWALLQAAVSKIAWATRFNGEVAYNRVINWFDDPETILTMEGL